MNTNELRKNSEQWASIDWYKNYQVSWWGRVRNATTGRILKGSLSSNGYLTVGLSKNRKSKTHYIHQLVAREWVPNPENKRCVDHIDCDKANNHHENLRYATHTENGQNVPKSNKARSSIYKGVSIHGQSKKWVVHIGINGKAKHVGLFASEREAAEAYNTARLNIFED